MKGISSMATRQLLADLTAAAVDAGLPAVELESVGGVDAAKRVAAGETFDLVFLGAGALAKLAADGHVDPETVTPLVLSQVAIGVPSGTDEPARRPAGAAFANVDGVREALRGATRIGYSTGPSGTALLRMIEEWGMTDEVGDRLVQARPGVPVARYLAEGEVDLGFQQLSELVGNPGVRILGLMPDDCAIDTVFSGAVARTAAEPDAAAAVLRFMAGPDADAIKDANSFTAPAA